MVLTDRVQDSVPVTKTSEMDELACLSDANAPAKHPPTHTHPMVLCRGEYDRFKRHEFIQFIVWSIILQKEIKTTKPDLLKARFANPLKTGPASVRSAPVHHSSESTSVVQYISSRCRQEPSLSQTISLTRSVQIFFFCYKQSQTRCII